MFKRQDWNFIKYPEARERKQTIIHFCIGSHPSTSHPSPFFIPSSLLFTCSILLIIGYSIVSYALEWEEDEATPDSQGYLIFSVLHSEFSIESWALFQK